MWNTPAHTVGLFCAAAVDSFLPAGGAHPNAPRAARVSPFWEIMTEYWVSQARHWCEYRCVYIAANKQSIAAHEGGKHKETLSALRDMRKRGRERRIERETQKELERVERTAMKEYMAQDAGEEQRQARLRRRSTAASAARRAECCGSCGASGGVASEDGRLAGARTAAGGTVDATPLPSAACNNVSRWQDVLCSRRDRRSAMESARRCSGERAAPAPGATAACGPWWVATGTHGARSRLLLQHGQGTDAMGGATRVECWHRCFAARCHDEYECGRERKGGTDAGCGGRPGRWSAARKARGTRGRACEGRRGGIRR